MIKLRSTLLCSLLTLTGVASALWAQPPASPAAAGATAPEHHTELEKKMGAIGKAFKKLRGQVADSAQNEDSMKLVGTIRENAKAAAKLEPAKKADLPKPDQAKFQADFVAGMNAFIADLDRLEAALKAGNNGEAKQLTEKLGADQKDAHKEFRKKKPEKK